MQNELLMNLAETHGSRGKPIILCRDGMVAITFVNHFMYSLKQQHWIAAGMPTPRERHH
jgi:hypothetical protein